MGSLSIAYRPLMALGLIVPASVFANPVDIVFAAQRFESHHGKVYQSGHMHLYRMRSDGIGLRRLTSGNMDDYLPSLDRTGKKVLFWRSIGVRNGPYRLYSMALDGTSVRRLSVESQGFPTRGLAEALLAKKACSLRRILDYGDEISIYGSTGERISEDETLISPGGIRAIVRGDDWSGVVDFSTGKLVKLDPHWLVPAWINDNTIVAFKATGTTPEGSSSGEAAYLDLSGKPTFRTKMSFSNREDGLLPSGLSYGGRAYLLRDRQTFLWVAHHSMSDGGYDFIHMVNLRKRTATFVANQTLEAVSPDGVCFLGTEFHWVGGYKELGAAKLSTMYIWDSRKLSKKRIGFRRMICWGACFVPVSRR